MGYNLIKNLLNSLWLTGDNRNWIENMYTNFLNDPNAVDYIWKKEFNKILNNKNNIYSSNYFKIDKYKILKLIDSFRFYGHKKAKIDPLNLNYKNNYVKELKLDSYGFNKNDLKKKINFQNKFIDINEIHKKLKKIYCNYIGFEYMHIDNNEEKQWIKNKIEVNLFNKKNSFSFRKEQKKYFLECLTAGEQLEKNLEIKFPSSKRFSLEGCEVLIVILNSIIKYSNNIKEIILGMAHRGRINVLANVFGKPVNDIFKEFLNIQPQITKTGDVKYHTGYITLIKKQNDILRLTLAFNPSHLEIINPVVMGYSKAKIDKLAKINKKKILSITIHGDASISAQGVIQETLNMSQTKGYKIGGTIRIILNNQIGFTTSNINDMRSTNYCTDIAKMINSPIFHVNADDPESVAFTTFLALDFLNKFNKDVFIDLVCYRRNGHSESDNPEVTQPIMYQKIKNHPTVRKIYAKKLQLSKIISKKQSIEMINKYNNLFDTGSCLIRKKINTITDGICIKKNIFIHTVNVKLLKKLLKIISIIPDDVTIHSLVKKIYNYRNKISLGIKPVDWGTAESLAYATLLNSGISCRISGEDSSRGTFFHRHAVIYDQLNNKEYIPLKKACKNNSLFTIIDSTLSEEATLAFEYGYSLANHNVLTIWEAQFGDFANVAQVVIDQFISTAESKWGQKSKLVILLPHGYEGQGPEHSSARLERFLQLCCNNNMQICIPSTPAQMYHILRFQINNNKPLIIITPKILLRHPSAISSLEELAYGEFKKCIDEEEKNIKNKNIKSIIFCSGKIYYQLIEKRREKKIDNIIIIRIEQIYPFPYDEIKKIISIYNTAKNFIWCQEEPMNQGAWLYIKIKFNNILLKIRYCGRSSSAATSTGYVHIHDKEQKEILDKVFSMIL